MGGARSAIVVANVGTYSGPGGSILKPVLDGAQVWVSHVNSRGGVNGHQVNLIVYDDGGDPARHKGQVQDAIERRKAIAFLANGESFTGEGSVGYLNAKGVPVVGTSSGTPWAYASPMYFPQASDGDPFLMTGLAAVADQVRGSGKNKLATVVCVEAPSCNDLDRLFAENAARFGFEHVYRARASLAQPDFTSECLASHSRGAEILMVVLDANSVTRVNNACDRQGFAPLYGVFGASLADRFKDDPKLAGLVGSTLVAPYFQTGTPATDEFHLALKASGTGSELAPATMAGWTAGKLLEKAGASLGVPPTSQALLAGLWRIQDDTLGGLTYPLSFTQGQPAKPRGCWFNITVKDRKWVSPDGYRLHCLD